MSTQQGRANLLYRQIAKLNRKSNETTPVTSSQPAIRRGDKPGDGLIIHCINDSGLALYMYTCVRLKAGATADDPPRVYLPEIGDDTDVALYGSLLNDCIDGESAFVKVSGKMFFLVADGTEEDDYSAIVFGETLYPLENETGTAGCVGNKATWPEKYIDVPVGKALKQEDSDTLIMDVISISGSPAKASDIIVAKVATTDNHGLTGVADVDGIAIVADDKVLVWKQTDPAENGVYDVTATGTWTLDSQYKAVIVEYGNAFGVKMFILSAANTYVTLDDDPMNVYVATTANHGLTGTDAVDAIIISVGWTVLVWQQTDASENGVYCVTATGTWVKIDQPNTVHVMQGNAFKTVTFMRTAMNVYTPQRIIDISVAKVATTANHGLTGTSNVDGIAISAGDKVLVWKQSTASQNGLYCVIATGSWVKIGQPIIVHVWAGSANKLLTFMLSAANTYSANYGVYAA